MKRNALIFSLIALLSACSSEPVAPSKTETPASSQVTTPVTEETPEIVNLDEKFQEDLKPIWDDYFKEDYTDTRAIDVFVVTNRKSKTGNFGCTNNTYGVALDKVTSFGICKINVPKNHSTGELTFTKDGRQSSHDYFKILNAKSLPETTVMDYMKKTKRNPLVFVHGFNVRYEEALLRAAQITYDLKYQGPVILFSWPSGAGDGFFDEQFLTKTYESNNQNAKASIQAFRSLMTSLANNNLKVNLVVHSMGHQVVRPGLKDFHKSVINELVLNAPDFEAAEFLRLIDNIKDTSKRITLYCSYNDKAMTASKTFNNNDRMGACTYSENLDTINVGLVDNQTLGLGHGYYSSRAILSDVFQVLLGIDAEKRLFIRKSEPNSTEKFYLRN